MNPIRFAAACLVLLPLCASASEREPKPVPATPAASAAAKPLPPIYDPMALGEKEIAAKKFACEQSNRRMFVDLGTNDCALCRVVNDAITEPKFQRAFLTQFIPAHVDVSPGSPNLELLKKWQIDPAKGLPAIVILDEQGKFSEATQDGEMAREAAKGTEAVQLWILKRFKSYD